MATKLKRSTGIVSFLVIAVATTTVVIMVSISVLTHMVLNGNMPATNIEIWSAAILMIGTLIGGLVLLQFADCAPVYTIIHGIIVLFVILIGALVIDGTLRDVLMNSSAVIFGNSVVFIMCLKRKGKKRQKP